MRRLTLAIAAVTCGVTLAWGEPAHTQASSHTGADLAAMIAAAAPGSTIEIGPGTYRGPFKIDKPVHLVGRDWPVLDGGGVGDVVEVVAPDVTIEGFVIRGTGSNLELEQVGVRVLASRATIERNRFEDVLFGIDLKASEGSTIRANDIGGKTLDIARRGDAIRLWRSDHCTIEANTIHDGRDSILWYSNDVHVRDNRVFRCRYGFHLMFSNQVHLENNDLSDNSVGVYFMYSKDLSLIGNRLIRNRGPSGYGIGLKDVEGLRVENNVFAANRAGVYIDGSPATGKPGEFRRNTFAYNDVGMALLPAVSGTVVAENNFIDNFEQVAVLGRGELHGDAFADNDRGNFWSDYSGYDLDGDGVGETEYASQKLFENLLDREPKLRLLLFSPAQQAIEFVGRALPAVQPEPKFSDPSPLVRPVIGAGRVEASTNTGGLLGAAAGLVGTAVFIAVAAGGLPMPRRNRANVERGCAAGGAW